MGQLVVRDHTPTASTYSDGDLIFRQLLPRISAGEPVQVDFSGIVSVPSAFVNRHSLDF
jgi:hypothetical protein